MNGVAKPSVLKACYAAHFRNARRQPIHTLLIVWFSPLIFILGKRTDSGMWRTCLYKRLSESGIERVSCFDSGIFFIYLFVVSIVLARKRAKASDIYSFRQKIKSVIFFSPNLLQNKEH